MPFKINNKDTDARDYVAVTNFCYSSSPKVEILTAERPRGTYSIKTHAISWNTIVIISLRRTSLIPKLFRI